MAAYPFAYKKLNRAQAYCVVDEVLKLAQKQPHTDVSITKALGTAYTIILGNFAIGNIGIDTTYLAGALDFLACLKALLRIKATNIRYDNHTARMFFNNGKDSYHIFEGSLWPEPPLQRKAPVAFNPTAPIFISAKTNHVVEDTTTNSVDSLDDEGTLIKAEKDMERWILNNVLDDTDEEDA